MTTPAYDLLLSALPRGPEYDADGRVLPFLDGVTSLMYATGEPSTVVALYHNGELLRTETTDSEGSLVWEINLPCGAHELVIARPGERSSPLVLDNIVIRRTATFHAALGECLDDLTIARRRMELGLSPWTADMAYLAAVHGVAVGLATPVGVSTEAYRSMVLAWYESLTFLGGTPRALDAVVSATAGSQPLVLPPAWLPGLDPSGSLLSRAAGAGAGEVAEATPDVAPGAIVAGSEFAFGRAISTADYSFAPNANATALASVHAAYGGATLAFPGPFEQPPANTTRRLAVTFSAGYDRGDVVVSAYDGNGQAALLTFTATAGATVVDALGVYVSSILSAAHGSAGTTGSVSIGWRDIPFVAFEGPGRGAVDDPVNAATGLDVPSLGSGALAFDLSSNTLSWAGGEAVVIPDDATTLTLPGPASAGHLLGLRNAANYDTQQANLIEFIGDAGPAVRLDVTDGASVAASSMATSINAALAGTGGYGAGYNSFTASVGTGTLRWRNPASTIVTGSTSHVTLDGSAYARPDAGDWLYVVMGLPRAMSFLASAYSSGTTLTVTGSATLPDAPFVARLGRGRRVDDTGFDLTELDPQTATVDVGVNVLPGDVGGWLFLTASDAANTGIHRIIAASGTEVTIVHESPTGAFVTDNDTLGTWVLYSRGELVTVVDVDTGTGVVTLEAAAAEVVAAGVSYGDGSMLEVASALPHVARGVDSVGAIRVAVDPSVAPTGDTSDTVTLVGSDIPLGLTATNATAALALGTYAPRRVILTTTANGDVRLTGRLPGAGARLPGWRLRAAAWVGCHTAGRNVRWEWSIDGGSTWVTGASVAVPLSYYDAATGLGALAPTQVAQEFEVPAPADDGAERLIADMRVRLCWLSGSASDVVSVDELVVEVVAHTDQWVVRNAREEDGTWWVYRWAPFTADPLVAASLATATETGIETVKPAAVAAQVFEQDVRLGTYTLAEWATATLVNVEATTVAPTELAYVAPITEPRVVDERLALTTVAPYEATLLYEADVDTSGGAIAGGDADVLLTVTNEAVSVPNDITLWSYQTDQVVRIDASEYNPGAYYLLRYRARTRATGPAIDLNDQADFADRQWYFDAPLWRHLEPSETAVTRTETLLVGSNGVAFTADPAYTTRATLRRNGVVMPASSWRWVSSRIGAAPAVSAFAGLGAAVGVEIIPTEVDIDALYTLTYVAASLLTTDVTDVDFEVRAAANIAGLAAATWVTILPHDPLPLARDTAGVPTNEAFQFRATWRPRATAAQDTSLSSRLFGLGARGLLLRGSAPAAPAIIL